MGNVNFEQFNKSFFGRCAEAKNISWFNKTGILPLTDNKNAEITISTSGTSGEYTGYVVNIVHKESGLITHHSFIFDAMMAGRSGNTCYDGLHIKEHCCENTGIADWYKDRPKTSEIIKMATAIMDYIKMW